MTSPSSDHATRESYKCLLAARPLLDACTSLGTFVAVPDRTLLHAGPPFQNGEAVPAPVLNSASAAAQFEGWTRDADAAHAAILSGAIRLAPAQDHGVVTPLALVVSPSMAVLRVSDAAAKASARYSPVNDGPMPAALRFGARHEAQQARLALLGRIGPALNAALQEPIPVLPILRAGLDGGDDLHGRVSAANASLAAIMAPRLSGEAGDYLAVANQFVLNVITAACAVMIGAGEGVAESRMVTAAGGNGLNFGWQIAGAPRVWQTAAAMPPVGPHFPHTAGRRFLPAIGDSAVIDACGFGAAALRYAPDMIAALRGHAGRLFRNGGERPVYRAASTFPPDLHLGLDADERDANEHEANEHEANEHEANEHEAMRGVMLAAIDADGEAGLVGRGVAPWPAIA